MPKPKAFIFCSNPTEARHWVLKNKPKENPADYEFIYRPDNMRGLRRGFDVYVLFGSTQQHPHSQEIFKMLEGRAANLIWVNVPEN